MKHKIYVSIKLRITINYLPISILIIVLYKSSRFTRTMIFCYLNSFILLIILILYALPVQCQKDQQQIAELWQEWLIQFKPDYINDTIQISRRFLNFRATLLKLHQLNDSTLGLNKFADLTQLQFKKYKGFIPHQDTVKSSTRFLQSQSFGRTNNPRITNTIYPTKFDWRDYNVVTSIKAQGECGDCWAFSTTAFFQSEMVRRNMTNNSVDLAQQFFNQCDKQSEGCDGGYLQTSMDLGLDQGIPYESQYRRNTSRRYPGICSAFNVAFFPNSKRVTRLYGISNQQIKSMLIKRPLNIAVSAEGWNYYFPGSRRAYKCPAGFNKYKSLDHTVLLVGWTETEWIVKNQWGSGWGLGGYMYVSNNDSEDCGIGEEVHTLNYQLSSPIQVQSVPIVPVQALPNVFEQPRSCHLANCKQCLPAATNCQICEDGYQINTYTKACIQQKIPNCIQVSLWAGIYDCLICKNSFILSNGACTQPESHNPISNTVTIIEPSASNISSCPLAYCSVCYDNGSKCLTCMAGYGINQITDACEKAPIEECNYFLITRGAANCFECKNGYKLVGNGSCRRV